MQLVCFSAISLTLREVKLRVGQWDKLKKRFKSKPCDFKWDELCRLLVKLGYKESASGKTSGSRVWFLHEKHSPISLHKPHLKPVLKADQVKQVLDALQGRNQL